MFEMKKVLCFTTSLNRLKYIRGCVFDIVNQSYPDIHHSINMAFEDPTTILELQRLIADLKFPCNTFVINPNAHQQDNHLNAIRAVGYKDYDLFVKIDDDDIYLKDYVQNIVERFEQGDVDMVSSIVTTQLNGNIIRKGAWDNLGGNPEDKPFHMPMTFAFNRKALDFILDIRNRDHYEDMLWRRAWVEHDIRVGTVSNQDSMVWNIHGQNMTTSNFLIKK